MTEQPARGFNSVLSNSHFRALWMAQWLAQTSQQAINFIQIVLIEQLTGSTVHQGLIILAFTVPGVIFSPLAGVVVDRFSKKWILVASNSLRVLLVAGYVLVLATLHGAVELVAIYLIAFLTASLAQFFSPAEASTIPLLVGEDRLLAANSLFNLTMALSQVIGLLILGPLAISLLQVEGGFVFIAAMYLAAALLVATLPRDRAAASERAADAGWRRMWTEAKEGWRFVSSSSRVRVATAQLVTIVTLVMIMAELAPGFATRVLGMAPANAVIVFAPAGVGMLLATGIVGRWGHLLRRSGFTYIGLALAGLSFAALGLVGLDYQRWLRPIFSVRPQATLSLTSATMVLAFILGFCMSCVNILAQTTVQLESPPHIRGRVFSVQYMLNNLVGIPPMLAVGGTADAIGIPHVLEIVGLLTILVALVSFALVRLGRRTAAPTLGPAVQPAATMAPKPDEVRREAR